MIKKWYNDFKKALIEITPKWCAVILCAIVVCAILAGVMLHNKEHIETIYKYTYNLTNSENLSPAEACMLEKLIRNDRIQPVSDVYNQTAAYYGSLITVLGVLVAFITAILAICAFVSWFSFKGKIRDEIEEYYDKMIQTEYFKAWIEKNLKEVFDKNIVDSFTRNLGDSAIKDKLFEELYYRFRNEIENEKTIKLDTDQIDLAKED